MLWSILVKAEKDPEETEVHPDQRNRKDLADRDHVIENDPDPVTENEIRVIKKKTEAM